MANPNKFTAKEVLNKVLLDSSGNAVTANSVTSQEALNSVLDTTNNRLNMSLAGGTISGDVTISGDLTVNGNGTGNYDEIVNGNLVVSSGNKLGVGTETPDFTLHVHGASDGDGYVKISDGNTGEGGTDGARIGFNSGVMRIQNFENSDMEFYVNNSTKPLVLESDGSSTFSGNVRIGTSGTPAQLLHLAHATDAFIQLERVDTSVANNDAIGAILFRGGESSPADIGRIRLHADADFTSSSSPTKMIFETTPSGSTVDAVALTLSSDQSATFAGNIKINQGSASGNPRLTFAHDNIGTNHYIQMDRFADSMNIFVNGSNAIVIDSNQNATFSGDVSIKTGGGSDDPATLALWSADTSITDNDTIGTILAQGSDSGGSPPYLGGKIEFNADANWDTGTTGYYPTRIDFFTESNSGTVSTGSRRMTIGSDGRVGIGTAGSPTHLLDLYAGTANAEGGIHLTNDDTGQAVGDGVSIFVEQNTKHFYIRQRESADVVIRTNDVTRMVIDNNSRISLSNNDSGVSNTIFGKNAGDSDGAGDYNVFVGEKAGGTGTQTDDADYNVGLGYWALTDLTNGESNVAVGAFALENNTSGGANVAIGSWDSSTYQAPLTTNQVGSFNIAIGSGVLRLANENDNDGSVGIGYGALNNQAGTGGARFASATTAVGHKAFEAMTTGTGNTAVGYISGQYNQTGSQNTYVGYASGLGASGNSHSTNTAVGYFTLKDVTTGGANTVIGAFAGDVVTTQDSLTLVGKSAGGAINNDGANGTVAVGASALEALTSGSGNLAVGYLSGKNISTGADNVGVGEKTIGGSSSTAITGDGNTALGWLAGTNLEGSANENTLLGKKAGFAMTTAEDNVAVGMNAGDIITTGSDNTIIGHNADVDANSRAGCIIIGSGLSLNTASDNVVEIGNDTNSMTYDLDGGDITVTSDVRTKKNIKDTKLGLEFINKLRPVTYQTKSSSDYPKEFDIQNPSKKSSGKTWDGLIAQEVKQVMDEMNVEFSGWEVGINTKQRLAYGKFVMPLIKAIQELSARVEELEKK